ncbi:hypothetical protein OEJ37_07840 [Burkholderia sp. BKH01]|uniref:hypothetical protein n=1 Tax=Burkholderia sp. BKH01 TaxID=2769262 RepID=UPI0021DF5D97|nr:hypothetical protein [Burkholderia sp. BKH01]MCU9953272.1 hypothetical protein [Burkholderia sp. BKH01]
MAPTVRAAMPESFSVPFRTTLSMPSPIGAAGRSLAPITNSNCDSAAESRAAPE